MYCDTCPGNQSASPWQWRRNTCSSSRRADRTQLKRLWGVLQKPREDRGGGAMPPASSAANVCFSVLPRQLWLAAPPAASTESPSTTHRERKRTPAPERKMTLHATGTHDTCTVCLFNKFTLRGIYLTQHGCVILQPATLVENADMWLKNHRPPPTCTTN